MQMLNSFVLLLLLLLSLYLCPCASAKADLPQEGHTMLTCSNYVGFKFIEQKKGIWVCAPANQVVQTASGIIKSQSRAYQYEITNFHVINFPPALFENKNGKLYINGIDLKDSITAVVGKDGTVFINRFIANDFK